MVLTFLDFIDINRITLEQSLLHVGYVQPCFAQHESKARKDSADNPPAGESSGEPHVCGRGEVGIYAASRAAAAIPPSQRTADDWKVINLGDKETRNADFKAREHERVYGRK